MCEKHQKMRKPPSVPVVGLWGFGMCSGVLPFLQWHSCLLRYSTHDIYQGGALTDVSKQLCGTAKKGSLVTLDKAVDSHTNLHAEQPCCGTLDQSMHSLLYLQQTTSQHNKEEEETTWKHAQCSHIHVFMRIGWLVLCNPHWCHRLNLLECIFKHDNTCYPCNVCIVYWAPPAFCTNTDLKWKSNRILLSMWSLIQNPDENWFNSRFSCIFSPAWQCIYTNLNLVSVQTIKHYFYIMVQ